MPNEFLDFNGLSRYTSKIVERFKNFVPTTRKINDKPLSGDIKLTYTDVGAQVSGSYVPTSRMINNKPLSSDITLTASDIGISDVSGDYVPTSRTVNKKALSSDIVLNAKDIGIITDNNTVSIGQNLNPAGKNAITIGMNATSKIYGGISIGLNTVSHGNGIAIGCDAFANSGDAYGQAIAIGTYASAEYEGSLSIGAYANSNDRFSMALGYCAEVYGPHSVAIGYKATTSDGSTIQLGDPSISALRCKVQLSTDSDKRDKTDIVPIKDGAIEFLKRIQTICYRYNGRVLYIPDNKNRSKKDKDSFNRYGLCSYDKEAHARGDKKGERIRVGVLAQEVQEALKEVYGSPDYANLVNDNFHDLTEKPTDVENQLTITYSNFIPFLIKAIQELSQELSDQNAYFNTRIEQLENKLY